MPPVDLPWEDLIQFRAEDKTIESIYAIRRWMRKQNIQQSNHSELQDEIDSLLYDQQKHFQSSFSSLSNIALTGLIALDVAVEQNAGAHTLFASAVACINAVNITKQTNSNNNPAKEISLITRANEKFQQETR